MFPRKLFRWWSVIAVHEVWILFFSHRHSTVHLMQKPHQCPHCPLAARMASPLRRHLRLHTGAKPYRCPYCSYTCNILVSSFAADTRNNSQIWIRSRGRLTGRGVQNLSSSSAMYKINGLDLRVICTKCIIGRFKENAFWVRPSICMFYVRLASTKCAGGLHLICIASLTLSSAKTPT
jgi:hypothetical protein